MRRRLEPSVVRWLTLAAALATGLPTASAQPISREDLPPGLRPWVPWVLDQVPTLGCATVQGQPVCLWPGQLRLDLGPSGGTFGLDLQADRAVDVRLPGSAEHWPQDVRLDGSPAPVFDRDGAPRLRVGPGRHRLAGRFAWSRLPESLSVPAEIGLVDLRLDGQAVPRPRRDEAGLLWLRAGTEAVGEGESLRLQVFRHVQDGIPLFVETRLELEVAGRAREITLPGALLPGTVPVAVSGDLPARVEKDALRVQVRGGRYSVSVVGARRGPPEGDRPPEGAAEGALAAARGVGLRRRRDAAAGRALRPRAHRPLADRAARGVARAARVPRGAGREPRARRGAAGRGRAAARRAHPRARALARSRRTRRERPRPLRRHPARDDAPRPPPARDARPHRRRRPGPARHRPQPDEGGRRRAAALSPEPRGRLARRPQRHDPRRRLDDRRRAAPGDPPRPARLEPPRRRPASIGFPEPGRPAGRSSASSSSSS